MKRAVIYARYSSDKQREESIDAQVRACKDYCIRKHYLVTKVYADEAKSGRDIAKRDACNQMMADAVEGKFDIIIFHKIDRNSRNEFNYYTVQNTLTRLGIEYAYAQQPIDDSPEGKMTEAMLVAAIGMVVNIICALVLHDKHGHNHDDYNRHSAYLHVLADALTSLGAIFGLICAMVWNITWIDPLVAFVCSVVIIRWAKKLLYDTGKALITKTEQSAHETF